MLLSQLWPPRLSLVSRFRAPSMTIAELNVKTWRLTGPRIRSMTPCIPGVGTPFIVWVITQTVLRKRPVLKFVRKLPRQCLPITQAAINSRTLVTVISITPQISAQVFYSSEPCALCIFHKQHTFLKRQLVVSPYIFLYILRDISSPLRVVC